MRPYSADVYLILRLMIYLHSRGISMSFGEIKEKLASLN